jgi:hypothetical protein
MLHIRSFEMIRGPKADKWLVKTVGILGSAIGGVLITAGTRIAVRQNWRCLVYECRGAGWASRSAMFVGAEFPRCIC